MANMEIDNFLGEAIKALKLELVYFLQDLTDHCEILHSYDLFTLIYLRKSIFIYNTSVFN